MTLMRAMGASPEELSEEEPPPQLGGEAPAAAAAVAVAADSGTGFVETAVEDAGMGTIEISAYVGAHESDVRNLGTCST